MAKVQFPFKVKYGGEFFPAHTPFLVEDKDFESMIEKGAFVVEKPGITTVDFVEIDVDEVEDEVVDAIEELTEKPEVIAELLEDVVEDEDEDEDDESLDKPVYQRKRSYPNKK